MSRRDLPALRRMKPERTWKDEVQERVQRRRSERASGARPLPLFPEEPVEAEAEGVAAPPLAVPTPLVVRRHDVSPVLPWDDPAPGPIESEVGEVDLRAPRTAPPAPGSPLDLPLQAEPEAPAAAEPEEGSASPIEPEPPGAQVLMLDDPPPEDSNAEPPGQRLDWDADDEPWPDPAPVVGPLRLPRVERPATPAERLNAALLDLAVIVAFWFAAVYLASRAAQVDAAGLLAVWPGLLSFLGLLGLVYAGWFTGSTGQTPGKMLIGLRVVDRNGVPLGVARALLRTAVGVLGTALLGAGLLPILFDPARRALHDRLVQARVVRS